MWVYAGPPKKRFIIDQATKQNVEQKANEQIEKLKHKFIRKISPPHQGNYVIDVYGKWYRCWYFFCSTYRCPGPNALSPTFESRFARIEYRGAGRFDLSFMRHTGEWVMAYPSLTLEQCLSMIDEDSFFQCP
jgi:hypothetical protein